jgi:hypothetical protein
MESYLQNLDGYIYPFCTGETLEQELDLECSPLLWESTPER